MTWESQKRQEIMRWTGKSSALWSSLLSFPVLKAQHTLSYLHDDGHVAPAVWLLLVHLILVWMTSPPGNLPFFDNPFLGWHSP